MHVKFWSCLVAVLVESIHGLQVTPNSKCAALCMDDPTTDVSDPNSSNTHGLDIVCNDADYTSTSVGRKYKMCIDCLQNSTASSGTENDQGWLMYNLRYALNTCIYMAANASSPVSTPCSTSDACGSLKTSLESGMADVSAMGGQYGYCSANDNAFNGSQFVTCQSCLQVNGDVFYMSNFLTALQAGCSQQPIVGEVVGLNDTLFSSNQVAIVAPASHQTRQKKTLTTGAIVGIAVAGAVIILFILALAFVCYRKRRNAARLNALRSPLHERFGAENISAPNRGAFSSVHATTAVYNGGIQMKQAPPIRSFNSSSPPHITGEWTGLPPTVRKSTAFSANPPEYDLKSPGSIKSVAMIPAHHAYIPVEHSLNESTSPHHMHSPPPGPYGMPSGYPQRSPSTIIHSNASSLNPSPTYVPTPTSPPMPKSGRRTPSNSIKSNSVSPNFPSNYNQNAQSYHIRQHSNSSAAVSVSNSVSPIYNPSAASTTPRSIIDEAGRRTRERLYREGLAGNGQGLGSKTMGTTVEMDTPPLIEKDRKSQASDEEEQWPGSY